MAAPAAPPVEASETLVGAPSRNHRTGVARPASTSTLIATAIQRRRTTTVPIRRHSRLSGSVERRCGQSNRGPATSSSAGSKVSAAITLITGISKPVNPTLPKNGTGNTISAAKLTATVVPENNTERPAVAIAVWTASTFSAPRPSSSRQRVTMSSA
jgi:hypothetical protein